MNRPELVWLAGDHHVHTAYSHDGTYTVAQQAEAAARHGLAWMVVTDHGGVDHAKVAVGPTHDDVVEVRSSLPQLLLFQGLEWNVPGSEHGTVFMAPGPTRSACFAASSSSSTGSCASARGTPTALSPARRSTG